MNSASTKNIIPTLQDLLKLEYLVAATGFSLLPKQPVHSVLAGKHSSKLRGRGLDFEEVRKYAPGDDVRNIDWRVTARTGITSTKVFTEEKEKPVLIVCDLTPSMFFGSHVYTKSYIAAQLAAIAAFKVLKNGDRFGGLIFNESNTEIFAPKRSRQVLLQYLQKLVDVSTNYLESPLKINSKELTLENSLRKTVSMATHDYLILVLSDFHDINTKTKKHLLQLSKHNDVILASISDPLERELPRSKLVLSDGDLQLLWNPIKKKQAQLYQSNFENNEKSFLTEMDKYQLPVMLLNTIDSIDLQLKSLFQSKLKINKNA